MVLTPVNIAIIGCTGYAFQLIKRTLTVPHSCVLVAVVSLDPESPQERFCREHGVRIFSSVEDLLAFGQFEAVMNPTPIHLHAAITKRCLEAGYPVWLEKPPVAAVQELDELLSVVDTHGLPVAVCFNSLYSHLTQNLKRQLVAGRFGKVKRIKGTGAWIRRSDYFNRNDWAGCLRKDDQWVLDGDLNNPFAHVLCNSLYFAAQTQHALADPATVEAELYRCNDIESGDTSCVRIITRDGVEIVNYLTLGPEHESAPETIIETERAQITYSDFHRLVIHFEDGYREEHQAYTEDRIQMIEHLCRAFRTGEPYQGSLEMMRPFTVAVNCAFDSAQRIVAVPREHQTFANEGGMIRRGIVGINDIMTRAFAQGVLYSEMGIPWAVAGHRLDATNYHSFPSRFRP